MRNTELVEKVLVLIDEGATQLRRDRQISCDVCAALNQLREYFEPQEKKWIVKNNSNQIEREDSPADKTFGDFWAYVWRGEIFLCFGTQIDKSEKKEALTPEAVALKIYQNKIDSAAFREVFPSDA
jgi:hypothetical protein